MASPSGVTLQNSANAALQHSLVLKSFSFSCASSGNLHEARGICTRPCQWKVSRTLCAATENAAEPSPPAPPPPIRRKFRSQWSKGDGPGEYGGPPIDFKVRTSWGGKSDVDPLSGKGGFIWNKEWKKRLLAEQALLDKDRSTEEEALQKELRERGILKKEEKDSGFLSLGRSLALDSIEIDLTSELLKPSKATVQRQVEEARRAAEFEAVAEQAAELEGRPRWRFVPTRNEEKKWGKARKASGVGIAAIEKEKVDPVVAARLEAERYARLKNRLLLLTAGMGGLGLIASWAYYTPGVALSYTAGAAGALVYVRMLTQSVDSLGSSGAGNVARAALGQPRLLVPVVLVMAYNRWNAIIVPSYDAVPLELIPMLVGFFTYKAATFVQTFEVLLPQPAPPKDNNQEDS